MPHVTMKFIGMHEAMDVDKLIKWVFCGKSTKMFNGIKPGSDKALILPAKHVVHNYHMILKAAIVIRLITCN